MDNSKFWLDRTLVETGYVAPINGDVGVEFEVEGKNLCPFNSHYWQCKEENSLRGGYEYVFKQPFSLYAATRAVQEWFYFKEDLHWKVTKNSLRTSIHVHVNATAFTLRQIYSIITAYYLLEDILIAYSGENRRGNLFCLGISVADQTIEQLVNNIINQHHFAHFNLNQYKYAALNIPALLQFGSLEFRMMRGEYSDPDFIIEWINQLHQLCQRAATFKNPKDILFKFKGCSPLQFLLYFFSEPFAEKLIEACPDFRRCMRNNFHYSFAIATALNSWDTPKDYKAPEPVANKKPSSPKKLHYTTQADAYAQMAGLIIKQKPALAHEWVNHTLKPWKIDPPDPVLTTYDDDLDLELPE